MSLIKLAWRTPCTIAVRSASDVDIVTDICNSDFYAIGDPLISKWYVVMILQLPFT